MELLFARGYDDDALSVLAPVHVRPVAHSLESAHFSPNARVPASIAAAGAVQPVVDWMRISSVLATVAHNVSICC